MGKTLRDKIRSDQLQQLSGIQDIVKWGQCQKKRVGCSREQNGGTTVWQRSPEIIVHREYVVEGDQRNDGKKVSA
jgi:hypothetical protein